MRIRCATDADAPAIGAVFVRARDEMTYLPRIPDEDRPLLGDWFLERAELWVAEADGRVVGFVGIADDELAHLYTDPPFQNRGVGSALLEHARTLRPGGLHLWVFQENDRARRFYERSGFRLDRLTDGGENMEREPDARYVWRPAGSRPSAAQS